MTISNHFFFRKAGFNTGVVKNGQFTVTVNVYEIPFVEAFIKEYNLDAYVEEKYRDETTNYDMSRYVIKFQLL